MQLFDLEMYSQQFTVSGDPQRQLYLTLLVMLQLRGEVGSLPQVFGAEELFSFGEIERQGGFVCAWCVRKHDSYDAVGGDQGKHFSGGDVTRIPNAEFSIIRCHWAALDKWFIRCEPVE